MRGTLSDPVGPLQVQPIPPLQLYLPDEAATTRLALCLSGVLLQRAGDGRIGVLLLDGPIGAGKSHIARALIRHRLGAEVEVPSPSFTLVQTYEGESGVEIWHADLYRLSHPDEVLELGLEAAFETALCLVEWPDRLGDLRPARALHLRLSLQGQGRLAQILCPDAASLAALRAALDG